MILILRCFTELPELWERVHNLPLCFMIIARFLPFFPNSTFLIVKSCSKSTAENQVKIWWLVCVVGWRVGIPLDGFSVVSDGLYRLRVISDGFRWFAVLIVTPVSQHTEESTLYCTHGRTWLIEVIRFFYWK